MTDLSNTPLGKLEEMRAIHNRTIAANTRANEAIDAEIERREAEPDYAAWEPKWRAFREAMGWKSASYPFVRETYIRALIAAHNTPLAGEDDHNEGWTKYKLTNGVGPRGVSLETHDIQAYDVNADKWVDLLNGPLWETFRYRPKQTDEALCDDCPPVGYPTDKTRCDPCPRRASDPKQTDGWIPWTGGDCPVPGDTRVDLKFKLGGYYNNAIASLWNWEGGSRPLGGNPIMAYRVVKEP